MNHKPSELVLKPTPQATLLSTEPTQGRLLAQDLIQTLEELILAQKKLNYFTKELKVWSTPKRQLPQI